MREPIVRIKNDEALKKRDDGHGREGPDNVGPHLRRWPGKVTEKLREVEPNGTKSGEWEVKITSKNLEDPVTARVNLDRAVGTKVQFVLDEHTDDGGKAAETFFEENQDVDPVTNRPVGGKYPNDSWYRTRFSESDYNA